MSFLKFHDQTNGNGRGNIYYHRAAQDGAPFRGPAAPLMRDAEFEDLTEQVYDCYSGTFDTSDATMTQHGRRYHEILEGTAINWFRLLCERQYTWTEKTDGPPKMYVYIEWAEPYNELAPERASASVGTRTQVVEKERKYDQPSIGSKSVPPILREIG